MTKAKLRVLVKHICTNLITHFCSGQILHTSNLGLYQMVTVNGGGYSHLWQPTADELKHSHLSSSVLHGHTVRTQTQVGPTTVDLLIVGVIEMSVYNLL